MRGLIQFFVQYGSTVLFVVLLMVCGVLIVQYNQQQRIIYFHSKGLAAGYIERKIDWAGDYYRLRREVNKVQRKNIELMQQLDNARYNNALLNDSLVQDSTLPMYDFIPANVISNSIINSDNYIRLNRGTDHGVQSGMGVLSDNGVVGIVRYVSSSFCSVMSVLHSQSRIKAAVKGSGYFGTLVWRGDDSQHLNLAAIPKHADIEEGDTVITSGYSQIFPKDIPIGVVTDASVEPGENFYDIRVRLYTDMGRLRYAYIADHLMKNQHQQLDALLDE